LEPGPKRCKEYMFHRALPTTKELGYSNIEVGLSEPDYQHHSPTLQQ